jgi:hypothetical protein
MKNATAQMLALGVMALLLAACGGGGSGNGGSPEDSRETIDGGGPPAGGGSGSGSGSGAGSGSSGSTPLSFGEPNANQIRPGVGIVADGSFCTSNFIYGDAAGNFYIGVAAHCFSPDANSGRDSCETNNLPIGTAVSIENAAHNGTLYYSSWRAMQDNRETVGSAACTYNDFALVRIDPRDNSRVHPAAIAFEGPTGLLAGGAAINDQAYSYGQSSSHFGVRSSEEKDGPVRSIVGGGWQYGVVFDNPGLPGDSGSAVLHESGQALGVLTVVSAGVSLTPVSNGVMNLEMGLDYANDSLSNTIKLVTWSRFTP